MLPLSAPSQPRPGKLPSHKFPSREPSPTHLMGLLLTTLLLSERLKLFGTPCGSSCQVLTGGDGEREDEGVEDDEE